MAVGGFSAEGTSGTKISKGVPTSAQIAGGAIVEREVGSELTGMNKLKIALRNPDFTTTQRVAQAINVSPGRAAGRWPGLRLRES